MANEAPGVGRKGVSLEVIPVLVLVLVVVVVVVVVGMWSAFAPS